MTLPVVVMKSLFQETPLALTGVAPPAFERNAEQGGYPAWPQRALETSPFFGARFVRTVVQHRDAVADEFDMRQLLRRNGRHQAVERPKLLLAAEVETLEHVVPEVDISPYLPPSSSCRAAAAFGSCFLGGGNSVISLSTRINIVALLTVELVPTAFTGGRS